MIKTLSNLAVLALLCVSCSSKPDTFSITPNSIGALTPTTQVKDLESIFENDSIIQYATDGQVSVSINEIDIYEKGGKKLLTLSPETILDSTSVINTVQVFDPRFKTDKNVNTLSTFKDIRDNYTISSTHNLINAVVVTVKEINASFTIDKKELPANLRFDMSLHIEASQIPDNAKIKYFFLNW